MPSLCKTCRQILLRLNQVTMAEVIKETITTMTILEVPIEAKEDPIKEAMEGNPTTNLSVKLVANMAT